MGLGEINDEDSVVSTSDEQEVTKEFAELFVVSVGIDTSLQLSLISPDPVTFCALLFWVLYCKLAELFGATGVTMFFKNLFFP